MSTIDRNDTRIVHAAFALALLMSAAAPVATLHAQGLDAEGAVEAIVGSDVNTGEAAVADEGERILAAIGNASAAAEAVRKSFNLDELSIVLLTDLDEPGNPVAAAIEENRESIDTLRMEIESSAIFYHAINSNDVLLQNVIALEFDGEDAVVFAVGGQIVR
jgi:hypothetical protein